MSERRLSPKAFNMEDMEKTYFLGKPLRDALWEKSTGLVEAMKSLTAARSEIFSMLSIRTSMDCLLGLIS